MKYKNLFIECRTQKFLAPEYKRNSDADAYRPIMILELTVMPKERQERELRLNAGLGTHNDPVPLVSRQSKVRVRNSDLRIGNIL